MHTRRALLSTSLLLAACANDPPAPAAQPEAPPPAVITEGASPAPSEPAPAVAAEPASAPQQTDTGRFRIAIASVSTPDAATPWVAKAQSAGYRTEILAVEIDGKTWHRVLLPGYASLDDARAAVPLIESGLGIQGAWVTSRRRAPGPVSPPAPVPAPAAASTPADAGEPTPKN